MSGRRGEAFAALAGQRRAWDRLPDGVSREGGSEFGQPERRVAHTEAWVLAKLGDTRAALDAVDAYLMYPVSGSGRARVELLRAEALVRGGDVDGGARYCAAVLSGLPGAWRADYEIVSSARAALGAVPAELGGRRPVREVRELLALPGGVV
jgi:hypothetical protein